MAVQTFPSTVTTSATQIYAYTAAQFEAPGAGPVIISNTSASACFLGGPTVTATTGIQLAANTNLILGSLDNSLWAVTASGTATVVIGVLT